MIAEIVIECTDLTGIMKTEGRLTLTAERTSIILEVVGSAFHDKSKKMGLKILNPVKKYLYVGRLEIENNILSMKN